MILWVWYIGAAFIAAVVMGWGYFSSSGGFQGVFMGVAVIGGAWAFTVGLPGVLATLWVGPKVASRWMRFAIVLVSSLIIMAPGLSIPWPSEYSATPPGFWEYGRVVLGFLAIVPLSLLVSHLLTKVPERGKRLPTDPEWE